MGRAGSSYGMTFLLFRNSPGMTGKAISEDEELLRSSLENSQSPNRDDPQCLPFP